MISAFRPEPGSDSLGDAMAVDHRQHARHGGVHEGDVRVGLGPEFGGGAREKLGVRGHLGVNLHADHQFPIVLGALNHLGFWGLIGQIEHGTVPG